MAGELWLWVKEKVAAFFAMIGRGLTRLWRFFAGWVVTVSGSTWRKVAVSLPVAFFLYIVIGMPIVHRVDDDLDFPTTAAAGASEVVADIAFLVKRETVEHGWTPNDPAIQPGWWLDNTPNFQKGIIAALSRFTFELRDQIGRTRGSSAVDTDLQQASGNLSKEPDRWVIDIGTSLLPTRPSDSYYKEAVEQLESYNARLAAGTAVYERRSDNLQATLDRIALDLGASSAALETYIGEKSGGFVPDFGADDLFYQVKGQVYAYTVILQALGVDFAKVIEDRELSAIYGELLKSLRAAATLDPLVVSNGARDGVLANHLSMQGFYLLRARTQLREVSNILLK